ncbi:MAG: glycosyltransferase family 4 protein [Gemmataceae bacterium]|nr:glycosyltransferase family 4 protein [Gemmataceae bacterium]
MNVVVSLEHRFDRTPDGSVWTQTQFAYPFWAPYLNIFEGVRVVARVRDVESAPAGWVRADGEGVSFAPVPYYLGPWQYLRRAWSVRRAARAAVGPDDAVIMRVSSQVGAPIEHMLRRAGRPYGVEVVADPYDVFAPGSVRHPLAPLFRWWFPRALRRTCKHACSAAYVTREALQRRYPCPAGEVSCSDVQVSESAFVSAARPPRIDSRRFRLIFVGTLAQLYKAPNVLIDATAACVKQGTDLELVIVGDGKHRPELETQAAALGIGDRVQFRGQLTAGDAVRGELDRADLFVLPSFQEGLPRAMVEAMARALPCVGSTVGGIPELLAAEEMVPPGDSAALAAKIREVLSDPGRLAHLSARNLETARSYRADRLTTQREAFYRTVRAKTEEWLATAACGFAAALR